MVEKPVESHREIPRPADLPPPMDDAAFYGLAGDIVNAIAPHTESSKEALLIQLLTGVGNLVGTGPHLVVEDRRHPPRLFVLVVGDTSLSGKGTSWGRVERVLSSVDLGWVKERILGSLSSGEGLIKYMKRLKGDGKASQDQLAEYSKSIAQARDDPEGAMDAIIAAQRLINRNQDSIHASLNGRGMLVQEEFGRTLRVMQWKNNTLPDVLREAFDKSEMTNPTVRPDFVDGVHFSAIGHITAEELHELFSPIDVVNGLGNRFLFVITTRRLEVPRGSRVPEEDMSMLTDELREVVKWAQQEQVIDFDDEAGRYWDETVYPDLTSPTTGFVGKLLDRGRVHVRRLALLYSILDQSPETTLEHLEAALAVWDYCAASAMHLFGSDETTGYPDLDLVVEALLESDTGKLTRSQINSQVFYGNKGRYADTKQRIDAVKRHGEELDVIEVSKVKRKGKKGAMPEVWRLKE